MKIKLLLIGSFKGIGDEALTQLSNRFYEYFKNIHKVEFLNTNESLKLNKIKKIIKFKPDIIHYLTGPTARSIIILWFYKKLLLNRPKTLISATRTYFNKYNKYFLFFMKPDLVFTQSSKWMNVFIRFGIATEYMPNPIDTGKFRKLPIQKNVLRNKFNLPIDKKLLLHVGHLRKNRGLEFYSELIKRLPENQYQVVIVGSNFFKDEYEADSLIKNDPNLIIINEFLENIEEIYNASDCYLFHLNTLTKEYFPRKEDEIGVIDMPLSILEAIACELPVVSFPVDSFEFLLKRIKNSPIVFVNNIEMMVEEIINKTLNNYYAELKCVINQDNVFSRINDKYIQLANNL